MEFTEKVLILRTGKFRESDLWVRLLSPSKGIITAFAFGGCKSRRRFCGCLDTLNQVLFRIRQHPRKKYYSLEEGTLINAFIRLKNRYSRLGMAVNCLRFLQHIHIYPEESSAIYSLLLDSLHILENGEEVSSFFPLLFKARLIFAQGYKPYLDYCASCKKDLMAINRPYFAFTEGKIYCPGCLKLATQAIETNFEAISFLNKLQQAGPKEWVVWNPPPQVRQNCAKLVDAFGQYHLGLS
ncbi:DNA repair protein RecO [Desulfohalobiaceae bacterium Ax17]|jgi:DNA repair protein RecO (recombination protein O)|uniref:DNA repair protein RecO n=1 Tax=Desulfovulcanus ferrireducens TaxID=2831190 RepID=UPI00207BB576|nr:DNA repair protein RecO [Desulfovulcanus ferrireducens]MBT8763163.1 DNA repair protein RecO [Desulfovulcanus ferrireducens]